jgi:hypothetical protein
MALSYPKYAVAGLGVPGTLAGTINSGDTTGATFTSSTALTNWLDLTGAAFANPIYVAVDYNPGSGSHTEEKMLVTVNTSTQTFTIVSRMVDYPTGTAPTPPTHSAGVSIVPIFTGTQLAEVESAVQLLKTILLNVGGTTTPQPVLVGSSTASLGSSPALAAADHNHYIAAATLNTWLSGTGKVLPNPITQNANYTANNGDFVFATATLTVTLPAAANGVYVGAYANYAASNGSPVTIHAPSGNIIGAGIPASSTSILLGTKYAFAILVSDGTNWYVIHGAEDTGWIAPSLVNSWTSVGSPWSAAGYRRTNGWVYCRGHVTGGTSTSTAFTLPAGYQPAAQVQFIAGGTGGLAADAVSVQITTAGVTSLTFAAGAACSLDAIAFPLT